MARISVFSRAHRTLRDTPRFIFSSKDKEVVAPYLDQFPAGESLGEVVGVYVNPPTEQPSAVVIAENGLFAVRLGASQWIKFAELKSIRAPSADDSESEISLVLKSGNVIGLRIAGSDHQFRDVFSFVRFLDRVLEDRLRTH
jgi:hypothetical protein